MRTPTTLRLLAFALVLVASATDAFAGSRGTQLTRDGTRVLVSKDVGAERWAITLNDDGTITGNVLRTSDGSFAFISCTPGDAPNRYTCFGADGCAGDGSGRRAIQPTPEGLRVLLQKDVGEERWAITLNDDDGTLTGNVYRTAGDPAFLTCDPTGTPNTFTCYGADRCGRLPCADQYTLIREVTLPNDFLAVPDGCTGDFGLIGDVTLPARFFVPRPTVRFTFAATAPLEGFQVDVAVPGAKGAFDGNADAVRCSVDVPAQAVFNNRVASDALTIIVASASALPFPVVVSCDFEEREGEVLTAGDLGVAVVEVVQNGNPADPNALSFAVDVD